MTYPYISNALEAMQAEVYDCNLHNGWFDNDRTFGDSIALIHSEASEALEAFRDWGLADATTPLHDIDTGEVAPGKLPKPEGVGSEFADVLIRLLDCCQRYDIDLAAEYRRKLAYNRTRGYHHGGRKL